MAYQFNSHSSLGEDCSDCYSRWNYSNSECSTCRYGSQQSTTSEIPEIRGECPVAPFAVGAFNSEVSEIKYDSSVVSFVVGYFGSEEDISDCLCE